MNILLLTGNSISGKQTAVEHLQTKGYKKMRFSDPIYKLCQDLGLDYDSIHGKRRVQALKYLGGKSSIYIQHSLFYTWGSDIIHPDIWAVSAAFRVREQYENFGHENFVFDDTVNENEVEYMTDQFSNVRVINIMPDSESTEPGEIKSQNNYMPFGYQITNYGLQSSLISDLNHVLDQ